MIRYINQIIVNTILMIVDHIGYAVNDIQMARKKFEQLGYVAEKEVEDSERNLRYLFLKNGELTLELIQPLNREYPTVIDSILKNGGAQPYHICYKVSNLEESINMLRKEKYVVIHKPKSALAMDNMRVAFLFNKDIGLVELTE